MSLTLFSFQESAVFALQKATAVCRSPIASADIMVVPGIGVAKHGAQSPLTTTGRNCGGTAGEEDDVSLFVQCINKI